MKYICVLIIALFTASCSSNNSNKKAEFYVRGNCGMCEERIEKAVSSTPGVVSADWNVDSKNLIVHFDSTKTNELAIQQVVANTGHETKSIASPQAIHDALPECCKKGSQM